MKLLKQYGLIFTCLLLPVSNHGQQAGDQYRTLKERPNDFKKTVHQEKRIDSFDLFLYAGQHCDAHKNTPVRAEFDRLKRPEPYGSSEDTTSQKTGTVVSPASDRSQIPHLIGPQGDVGQILRMFPGVNAIRRGSTGLDPVVEGYREAQTGIYLDGNRVFQAGPRRMDAPVSHIDPAEIEEIRIVKGPYALAKGAGNFSVIDIRTKTSPENAQGLLNGQFTAGFETNNEAIGNSITLHGTQKNLDYRIYGSWREGNNYTDGDGNEIPGDFRSGSVRGTVNYEIADNSGIGASFGYRNQDDSDFAGRFLDSDFFEVYNTSLTWNWRNNNRSGILRSFEALAYYSSLEHAMNNERKPTSDAPLTPLPFIVRINVDASADSYGGRASFELVPAETWNVELGGDLYSVHRNSARFIRNKNSGFLLFEDNIWAGAALTNAGLFSRIDHQLGSRTDVSATVRVDQIIADSDPPSDFFIQNISDGLSRNETNLSGSLMIQIRAGNFWSLSAVISSVSRTADSNERYSNRYPSTRAQSRAEFIGNPGLNPERSNQFDIWIEREGERTDFKLNLFTRYISDYITYRLTDSSVRLPTAPSTVFQYRNGDAAFWGVTAQFYYGLTPAVALNAAGGYLWGENRTTDEPVFGISPLTVQSGLKFDPPRKKYSFGGMLRIAAEQERVANTLGELPTRGYAVLDLSALYEILPDLRAGAKVRNLFDKRYVNHLNTLNPFAGNPSALYQGVRIPEPGRSFLLQLSYRF